MTDLLELALSAHGGLERWKEVKSLDVRISLIGGLYRLKGFPEGVPNVTMRVNTQLPEVTISPYAEPRQRGYFTPDRVWIEDREGKVMEERHQPRDPFKAKPRELRWDQLDRLYFTSYALWNYLTTPFLLALPGFETKEVEPRIESGETWRCLSVRFPPNFPTHSEEQTFYFNEKGLLQRLDYVAVAPASHYCYDHANFDGIVFPTLRRVVSRTPERALVSGPTAVLLEITDILVS